MGHSAMESIDAYGDRRSGHGLTPQISASHVLPGTKTRILTR